MDLLAPMGTTCMWCPDIQISKNTYICKNNKIIINLKILNVTNCQGTYFTMMIIDKFSKCWGWMEGSAGKYLQKKHQDLASNPSTNIKCPVLGWRRWEDLCSLPVSHTSQSVSSTFSERSLLKKVK